MSTDEQATSTFRERVYPNPFALIWVLLIFPTCYLTFLPIQENVGVGLGLFLSIAVLVSIWLQTAVIDFDGRTLSVANVEIPLHLIKSVEVINPAQAFTERGVKLNAQAFVRFQATVKTMAKIHLNDPEDPTPYWLVSCRRPSELKLAIDAAKN